MLLGGLGSGRARKRGERVLVGLRLMGGREEGAGEVEVGLGQVLEVGLDDMEERAKVLVVEEQSVQVKRACDIDEQHQPTPSSPVFPPKKPINQVPPSATPNSQPLKKKKD